MLSDEIRKRLKKLNRILLRESLPQNVWEQDLVGESRKIAERQNTVRKFSQTFIKPSVIPANQELAERFVSLREAIEGYEITNPRGKFLLVQKQIEDFTPDANAINSRYHDFISSFTVPEDLKYFSRQLRVFLLRHPSRILYLDIETTGLWSTPLFLIGLMFMDEGKLMVHQLFAREYAEEAAVLEYLKEFMQGFDTLITFNGKSFDMRFIRDRSRVNMVDFAWNGVHLDLLHEGRRRYRKKFENCRLITLEERVIGRLRSGDIPGHQIPDEYHYFVRTGNAWRLRDIFYHNGLDLITMAELLLDILSFKE